MLTTQHFIMAAKRIMLIQNTLERKHTARHYAFIFHRENPGFDRQKFYSECGVAMFPYHNPSK